MFQGIVDYYNNVKSQGDSRSKELYFVEDPIWVFCAAAIYLTVVILGPKFMQNRQAFGLRNMLIVYNGFSVTLSLWMMYEFFVCSFLNPGFNLFCEDMDEDDRSPTTMRLINVHWWYFLSKVIEFMDTFFFVLRKKNNQISFLHVYHHTSMLLLQWSLVKYIPGGVSYFGPMLNCFIHTLMYAYYGLAAIGPHMQKYLWWKKYLTRMQMAQFVCIFLYCANAVMHSAQPMVKTMLWIHWIYMISLFYLFNLFYQTSYIRKTKPESKSDSACCEKKVK